MVCSRALQFDEPALLKVVRSMLGGYDIRTHVLFPRPTPMLAIPNPLRASPFCSNSFGPHFEKMSEVLSTSASRSFERRSRCLSINVDTLSVDMCCNTRARAVSKSVPAVRGADCAELCSVVSWSTDTVLRFTFHPVIDAAYRSASVSASVTAIRNSFEVTTFNRLS
jgi:hypothetical protein